MFFKTQDGQAEEQTTAGQPDENDYIDHVLIT